MRVHRTREAMISAAVAAVALVFLAWRARHFFPNAQGLVGVDYGWFFPTLVVGHDWFLRNGGLSVPYFTPAFCGGVPFLANPQSVVFSLPQLLLTRLDPVGAMLATLLLFAAIGAAGCYRLLTHCFRTSVQAATLGASLFLLNGFLFYRMVIGHLTYHAFALAPVLACVVLSSHRAVRAEARPRLRSLLPRVVLGGSVIAYLTYGGALNFQLPVMLTVVSTLLILEIRRGFDRLPWIVLGSSYVWGGLLSALKLVPAAVLADQFRRPYIPQFLFASRRMQLFTLVKGFFAPAALSDRIGVSSQISLGRHEFEFGVSVVPLLLICLALLVVSSAALRSRLRIRPGALLPWVLLGGVLLIPLLLTGGSERWGLFLLKVPIINNNTTLVRWWAIYLPPLLTAAALCFDVVARRAAARSGLLVLCIGLAIVQESAHNPLYYSSPETTYDPAPVVEAYRGLQRGVPLPAITHIGIATLAAEAARDGSRPPPKLLNAAFLEGRSSWPCYEPLFGYRRELLPDLRLVEGPVTLVSNDQRLNLVDPSAYLAETKASGGMWRFPAHRLAEARKFTAYQPYSWAAPLWHTVSTTTTIATLCLSMLCLVLCAVPGLSGPPKPLSSEPIPSSARPGPREPLA